MAERILTPNRLTGIAIGIPVLIAVWQSRLEYGWLELTFGWPAPFFWALVLVWLAAIAIVIKRRRRWWLLLTVPVILLPTVMGGMLLWSCLNGVCL